MTELSKRQKLLDKVELIDAMICPVCAERLGVLNDGLCCANGHQCDVNKKGFINLLRKKTETYYDETLFAARKRVFEEGFYKPVMEAISSEIGDARTVLDAGCGEGYYLDALAPPVGVGVDISKEAIEMAAKLRQSHIWCVCDLAALPFQDNTFDAVLDILSPANYNAFFRVLKKGGKLIKVYPNEGYLQEIRECMGLPKYDAGKVGDYLDEAAQVIKRVRIQKTTPVTEEVFRDFVHMTPLTQTLSFQQKETLANKPASHITIDLTVAVAICKEA